MNVLWIVNHHATTLGGTTAGARHAMLAEELRSHNWDTCIIAGSTEHHTGHRRLRGWRLWKVERSGRATFLWIRTPRSSGTMWRRIAAMLCFTALILAPRVCRHLPKPTVVIGSSVHPLAAWAGMRLAKRHDVPFLFEIRDLWPETLITMGAIKRTSAVARALARLEKMLCDQAQVVITTMPFAYEYLVKQGVDAAKVVWVSNGVQLDTFIGLASAHGHEGVETEFLYFGAFGKANRLDILIEAFGIAFRATPATNVRLRLVGDGPVRRDLVKQIAMLGLEDKVVIEGPVPRGHIPAIAARASALVLCLPPLRLYDYGMSLNKLFEYMASGRPILFAGRARGNPILDGEGGIVTDCSVDAVARGLTKMLAVDGSQRDMWGAQARRIAESQFAMPALAARMALVLAACEKEPLSAASDRWLLAKSPE